MEQKWQGSDPFAAMKPQGQTPDVKLSAPDVEQVLEKIKPKDETRYCSRCGLQVEACQHINGVHDGNTYNSWSKEEAIRAMGIETFQYQVNQALGIKRQCGCF